MNWDVPSFARYFVILIVAFLVALYQIHTFKNKIDLNSFFYDESSNF